MAVIITKHGTLRSKDIAKDINPVVVHIKQISKDEENYKRPTCINDIKRARKVRPAFNPTKSLIHYLINDIIKWG